MLDAGPSIPYLRPQSISEIFFPIAREPNDGLNADLASVWRWPVDKGKASLYAFMSGEG
jgi:hypothetical protein